MKAGKLIGKQTYGSNSNTSSKISNKKATLACPKCKYSTRVYYVTFDKKTHNASYECPTHGKILVNIGNVEELPKNAKKRKALINKYK